MFYFWRFIFMKYTKYSFNSVEELEMTLKNVSSHSLDFINTIPNDVEEYEFLLFSWKSDLQNFLKMIWEKNGQAHVTLSGSLVDSESEMDTFILILNSLERKFDKVIIGGVC